MPKNLIRDLAFTVLGILSATLGLKGFLLPNGLLDGGVTGISLLINKLTTIDISLLIFLINIPFIVIGSKQVSKSFALKTFFSIAGLSLAIHFIQFPNVTDDRFLISIFGGFFIGSGIGLAIRGGSVIDGTEIIAIFVSRNTTLSVGDFIAIFNSALFIGAAYLFSIETAMYSMITYFSASKMVDFLITGIEEYIGVTIISQKSAEIKESITANLGRAVTVYKGEGGYTRSSGAEEEKKILFAVVTRLEVHRLTAEVEKIDANAFVIQHTINDAKGGMIKKRPLH